jgi:hypothetical protein
MQSSYELKIGQFYPGMLGDARYTTKESFVAGEPIMFGRGLAGDRGDYTTVFYPKNELITLTLNADLVSLNVINGNINGIAIAPVTYATSHNATMTAIAAAIMALAATAGVTSAVVTAARVITVEAESRAIAATGWLVTLGASQPTITPGTATTDSVFRGIALHEHNQNGLYPAKSGITALTEGNAVVETSIAVAVDDDAYMDMAGAVGKFTNVSTNNLATGGKFKTATSGAGMAKVSIRVI